MRERPMVGMTCRLARRRRISQMRSGGRPRALAEPVSISTVTGCMYVSLEGGGRRRMLVADTTWMGHSWEGRLLLGLAQQGVCCSGTNDGSFAGQQVAT